ncbi:auxin-responsive protein IAA33-like [Curcuma longa]|uniref:auxin-responsive protein IAA33-like n=1 Tax=Curcuma longa TaxID=136217 RepID=UPI003D9EA2BD
MNGIELHHGALKRRWVDEKGSSALYPSYRPCPAPPPLPPLQPRATSTFKLLNLSAVDDCTVASVVPPVTVVLEGRAICHRVCLDEHTSYESLAKALRRMFVDAEEGGEEGQSDLALANAVPGYVVAYEDMEDDLLLAGDLNWKDFVRVAKRIRIVPSKVSRRRKNELVLV